MPHASCDFVLNSSQFPGFDTKSMDLVQVLSNLHALRQLYELLQNIEDDTRHSNSNNVHLSLDPRTRKLFKQLLDDATDKMFHTHSKITEPQSVGDTTPCSSQLDQTKTVPKPQYPLSPDTAISSQGFVLNNEKDDSKSSMVTSEKDERYLARSQSAMSVSIKKRCRTCIAKELERQSSTMDGTLSNERTEQCDLGRYNVDKQPKILPRFDNKTIKRDATFPSSVSLETEAGRQEVGYIPICEKKTNLDEVNDFAKVVTNAIRQIESCILALQLSSGLTYITPTKNVVDEHVPFKVSISVSPTEHSKEDATIGPEMNQTRMGEPSLVNKTQLTTQPPQKHGMIGDSVSGVQRSPVENDMKMTSNANALSVSPSSPNEATSLKPVLQLKKVHIPVQQTSEIGVDQNQTGSRRRTSRPQQLKGSTSQTRRHKAASTHDPIVMRPVFLDDDLPCDRTRTRKMSNAGARKKLMPRQEESEDEQEESKDDAEEVDSNFSPRSSSVWSSKQNESSASSLSNYTEETWSPSNNELSETESNSQESSSSYHSSTNDRSRMTESGESDYSNEKYSEKRTIGRFKKIKNKLGLIFHHHHHHHHHHHNHGNDRSTWKKVQKLFHRKDKRRKNDHGQDRGDKKSQAVKNIKKNKGGGNFHALVKGLVRHTKKSKKTKRGPRQVAGLGKKAVNKLHWWQTYRRGVKLPKRGRVKVPKLPMKR